VQDPYADIAVIDVRVDRGRLSRRELVNDDRFSEVHGPPSSPNGLPKSKQNKPEPSTTPPPSHDELKSLVRDASELVTILAYANPTDRRTLYTALGLRLTYQPDRRRVVVECRPDGERLCKSSCRRGDLNPQVPKDTWPSTMRVCLFRHADESGVGQSRSMPRIMVQCQPPRGVRLGSDHALRSG
jgi:hypothetical protein